MIQTRSKRNSILKPNVTGSSKFDIEPSPSHLVGYPNSVALGPNDIIMANTTVMKQVEKLMVEDNPLDALNIGVDDETNVDMYLNLQNIEDVKMSTDSS